jgi:hypothetical protein
MPQHVKAEVPKPAPIEDDEELLAAISTRYEPPGAACTAAKPKMEEQHARIFAIGQYVEKLKETYKDVKQFDVFVFTDERTQLRSEASKAGKPYQRYIVQPLLVN